MLKSRLTYANVAATLALVFAMSGGALAASKYVITSTKQISPKVVKSLKGKNGKTGAAGVAGAPGTPGAQGKEGPTGKEGLIGKEGKEGKEGKTGEAGSALGYATVASDGTLNTSRSKGVISVTHPVTGLYCFDLSFTPNVAVATAIHISGNFKTFAESAASPADVLAFTSTCTAPNNDASVVTADEALIDDGFYVTFN
jgi:hypothetical protein